MSAEFKRLQRVISMASRKCISSPESVDGLTLWDLPDGRVTVHAAPAPVLASPSVLLVKTKARKTSAICGQTLSVSSASQALQSGLASRLRTRLRNTGGSIEYALTWKEQVTPAQRPYCLLRASGRRTLDTDFFGWPTAADQNAHDRSKPGQGIRERDGRHSSLPVALAGWATSKAEDSEQTGAHRGIADTLNSQCKAAGWATAAARDFRSEEATDEYNQERWDHTRGKPLNAEVLMAGYPTPQALSFKGSHQPGMNRAIAKTISFFVEIKTKTVASKYVGSRLNPAFSLWLMGFPVLAWLCCGVRATRSVQKLPRNSSKRTTK